MRREAVIIPSCGSNLASLQFALERIGAQVPLTEDPDRIRAASHVILPGVGAAQQAGVAVELPAGDQNVALGCLRALIKRSWPMMPKKD